MSAPVWADRPPEQLPAWQLLSKLASRMAERALPAEGGRFEQHSTRLGPLLVDYSKQRVDGEVMAALAALAEQSGIDTAIGDLFAGALVNGSERRPALHMALRAAAESAVPGAKPAARERDRFLRFAEDVRAGRWRGAGGEAIDTVLHIGIGGSHLGPALVCDALADGAPAGPAVRFLTNVDGHAAARALAGLDPQRTLVVVVSKSMTTLETRTNAESARRWFVERTGDAPAAARHFVTVSASAEPAAAAAGPPAETRFSIWDWAGGRFSLWSAAGLPVAIAHGRAAFEELLDGARLVDAHFRGSAGQSVPLRIALIDVWNANFLGAATRAVLAYDHRLRLLPPYLQQLEMESNGKSVRQDGAEVAVHTAPVVWGGEGTDGQHSFHQLLHQGTRAFSADFLATIRPGHGYAEHHAWLLANCLAQSEAMLLGDGAGEAQPAERRVRGGHPSTTILLDELTPGSLGALLALYEHRAFCSGAIWQINSFDQWGVELGKRLAGPIYEALHGRGEPSSRNPLTAALVEEVARRSSR